MLNSHHHSLPKLPKLSRLGRSLAALQVVKETLTIIFLGLPLVRAVPLVLLMALPGMVLYLLHWHLVLGRPPRRLAVLVWVFTLIDEIWGLFMFEEFAQSGREQFMLWSYFAGLAIILSALLEIGWRWQRQRAKAKRNVHHHAMAAGRARR